MSNPSNIARSLPQPRHSPNHSTIPNAKLYFSNRYLFNVPSICLFLHATKFRQRPWKPTLTFRIVVESQRNYPTRAIREWFRKDYTNKKERGKKERREDGRRNGKEKKRRRGKCPPTEQRSAASSTVQGESSAKRGKGTKKELPRVGKQAPGFVCPRIFHRVLRTRVGNESTCVSARRVKREWKPMNDIMHCFMPWIPSRYRHLLKTGHRSWPLLFFSFFRFTDWTMCSLRLRFHTSDTFWMTSKILRIFVYSYTVIEEWHLQQRYEEIIYSWWFRKFRNAGVQMKGMNRCFLSTFVCGNKKEI